MSTLVITIISLCAIGVVSAVILYFVAQKFKVEEDPRIDIVEGLLPGANCGGCGYPGCRGLAEAAVKSETMEGILWLRYDVWTFLFSLIACIGIPVLAALIPLRKIIKMKPVDAIKG